MNAAQRKKAKRRIQNELTTRFLPLLEELAVALEANQENPLESAKMVREIAAAVKKDIGI